MDAWVGVDITSVRTSFYNFVYTGNLFNLREGGEKRKRKRDHKVSKIEQQNNQGDAQGTFM